LDIVDGGQQAGIVGAAIQFPHFTQGMLEDLVIETYLVDPLGVTDSHL